MNFTLAGLILAMALGIGGWGGYRVTRMHYLHVIEQEHEKQEAQQESARLRDHAAAARYATAKAAIQVRTVTVTREVENALQADSDCSSKPLLGELRDILTAAEGSIDQSVPDDAVRLAPVPASANLGGRGAILGDHVGRASGLSGEASSAR